MIEWITLPALTQIRPSKRIRCVSHCLSRKCNASPPHRDYVRSLGIWPNRIRHLGLAQFVYFKSGRQRFRGCCDYVVGGHFLEEVGWRLVSCLYA